MEYEIWDVYMKNLSKKDSFHLLNYYNHHNNIGTVRNDDGSFGGHHLWKYMRLRDGIKTYHHGHLWNIYRMAVEIK